MCLIFCFITFFLSCAMGSVGDETTFTEDAPVNIIEQRLPHFERKGFAAIEWGGMIYK